MQSRTVSLLDRVRACTDHDPARYVPLAIDGVTWGLLLPGFAAKLAPLTDRFVPWGTGLAFAPRLDSRALRSDGLGSTLRHLCDEGLLAEPWRDEKYPVMRRWGDEPVLEVERSAITELGMPAFGVHLNGYVRNGDDVRLWVARRAATKATWPGKLDHIAAGGQPVGLGLRENMLKEADEEAGIPADLAEPMEDCGALSFRYDMAHGVRDDTIFTYDLELPADFVPVNRDGEVESFALLPIGEITRLLAETDDFKRNDATVILDFLVRRDLLGDHPELAEVTTALEPLRVIRGT